MRIRGVVAAVFAAVLLLVSACGSSSDSTDSGGSSGGSVDQGSTQQVSLTSNNFVDTVTKAQLDAGSSHVQMDMTSQGQTVKASGDVLVSDKLADTKMSMTMQMPGKGTMDMRLVDEILYMNMGQMTQNKFVKIDLTDPSNPVGKSFAGMADRMDPANSVEQLDGAITKLDKAGDPVEIDGVEAQPYSVTVDTKKMTQNNKELGAAAAGLPDTVTYKFWVGVEDHLPRKFTTDVAGADVEVLFTKWGESVDVKAPPKSQISDKDPFAGMPSANG